MSDSVVEKSSASPLKWKRLLFIFLLLLAALGITALYLKDEKAQNQTLDLIQKIGNKPVSENPDFLSSKAPSAHAQSFTSSFPNTEMEDTVLTNKAPDGNESSSFMDETPFKSSEMGNTEQPEETFLATPASDTLTQTDRPVHMSETVSDMDAKNSSPVQLEETSAETSISINHSGTPALSVPQTTEKEGAKVEQASEKTEQANIKPEQIRSSSHAQTLLIALRDDFVLGRTCAPAFHLALNALNPDEAQKLVQTVSGFCLNNGSVYDELEHLFQQNKTKALRLFYRELDPSWKGYVKSIVFSLIQIRDLNPTEERMENILDHAQLALDKKQIDETVRLLQQLPPLSRQEMRPYLHLAEQYLRAKKTLDELISNKGV